ncbi:MAG: peptidase [Clostridia bacterium]|nr:peptidase [Clostridia bacterium]
MKAVVISPLCPLMSRPSRRCERADEALYGMTVEILGEACPGWYEVRTHYRYTGYAAGSDLLLGDGNAERWGKLPKKVVLKGICDVQASPDVQSWAMATLTRGALVSPSGAPNENGWQKVSLPDGQEGYIKCSFLWEYYENPSYSNENDLRAAFTATALTYLGAHYRWGGKSPMGIDCSGLTAMSYLLNGVVIYRDAHIKEGFPLREIPRGAMKPGDLLFFPGHVAMYLGDGKYIHSTARNGSDGVVINSLNPGDADYREDLDKGMTAVGSIF